MTLQTPSLAQTAQSVIGPLPENLLREPLDYLQADHLRQRKICDLLDRVLGDPDCAAAISVAASLLDFLAIELPRHIADEEDLFTCLRGRCTPDDRIEELITALREDHAKDTTIRQRAETALAAMKAGNGANGTNAAMAVFAEAKRRHIRWENELLLPLARARLESDDLKALGQGMAERRGIPYPE